jgi:hypothetical protein
MIEFTLKMEYQIGRHIIYDTQEMAYYCAFMDMWIDK